MRGRGVQMSDLIEERFDFNFQIKIVARETVKVSEIIPI